jgi:predicted outer membrane repeat protein
MRRGLLGVLLVPVVLVVGSPADATTVAVGTEAEYRAALATLSADASGSHTIDLTADILVDDGTDPTYTGAQDLTIDGHGHYLDGDGASRLLVVDSPTDAAVHLVDVWVQGGSAVGDGGAVLVRNASPVTITGATFVGNVASGSGGAVQIPETAQVERSRFVDNVATAGDGGAVDATAAEGAVTVRATTFLGNRAPAGAGGALSAVGFGSPSAATGIQGTTFEHNDAAEGGALVVGSGLVVANSTFLNNSATVSGGAVLGQGTSGLSALIYVTMTGNGAPEGASLTSRGRDLYVIFTALGEASGSGHCAFVGGAFQVNESMVDGPSCPGARQVDDLGLGEQDFNGGTTYNRAPQPGSPLIDAIDANYGFPSIPGGCADFQQLGPLDQRGVERPQDGDGRTRTYVYDQTYEVAADCDIGAVEADAVVVPPTGPVAGGPAFTG